jgi:hypothetical protein
MSRNRITEKRKGKKRISQGEKLRALVASDEMAMKSGKEFPVADDSFGTPWGPLSIRQEAWVRALLNPDEAAGDPIQASRYAGCSQEVGLKWMNLPQIRARISHAMGESWVTPEAIVAELAGMGFDPDTFPPAKVRALELLAKIRGMLVERSISANVDVNDRDGLAGIILKEIERVAPDAIKPDIVDAEVVSTDGVKQLPAESEHRALKPEPEIKPKIEYPECLRLVRKDDPTKFKIKHGAWRIAGDGAICERCGLEQKVEPNAFRDLIQKAGYRYKGGIWYRPKFNGK